MKRQIISIAAVASALAITACGSQTTTQQATTNAAATEAATDAATTAVAAQGETKKARQMALEVRSQ